MAKTTTARNLGIGHAKAGKRVLIEDAGAQGSHTARLGYGEPDIMEYTMATVPGNIELFGLEVSLAKSWAGKSCSFWRKNMDLRYGFLRIISSFSIG